MAEAAASTGTSALGLVRVSACGGGVIATTVRGDWNRPRTFTDRGRRRLCETTITIIFTIEITHPGRYGTVAGRRAKTRNIIRTGFSYGYRVGQSTKTR